MDGSELWRLKQTCGQLISFVTVTIDIDTGSVLDGFTSGLWTDHHSLKLPHADNDDEDPEY